MFSQFPGIREAVSLHLVEVSPKLTQMQQEKLTGQNSSSLNEATNRGESGGSPGRQSCMSKYGVPVSWYNHLSDVPCALTFYIAHEFFDALPIHKFQVCL